MIIAGAGAALIVLGSAVSSLRSVWAPDDEQAPAVDVKWWAILSFVIAQLFLAGEKVFEDGVFERFSALHPLQMFAWTMVTQFVLGWVLYPLQTVLPGMNASLTELPIVAQEGALCTIGQGDWCTAQHTALFWVYCLVDFHTYFFGLCARAPSLSVELQLSTPYPQATCRSRLRATQVCHPKGRGYTDGAHYSDRIATAADRLVLTTSPRQ